MMYFSDNISPRISEESSVQKNYCPKPNQTQAIYLTQLTHTHSGSDPLLSLVDIE